MKVAYVSDNNVVRASGEMLCYLRNILFTCKTEGITTKTVSARSSIKSRPFGNLSLYLIYFKCNYIFIALPMLNGTAMAECCIHRIRQRDANHTFKSNTH